MSNIQSNTGLRIEVDGVPAGSIPNTARFAEYIGVVSQINGSLIKQVRVSGIRSAGPESVTPDGEIMTLGFHRLPRIDTGKRAALATWCGVSLHGFAHSMYSPRTNEPLRATLARLGLHKQWNMIEDARIERLLVRDFPGWQPHLMAAVNYLMLGGNQPQSRRGATLGEVYPLICGRTYLPAELRQEAHDEFAAEHSDFIADAVRDLIYRYVSLQDPGSADHDETVDIVQRLKRLLGDFGSDCGSSHVNEGDGTERRWTDPGDPSEDDGSEWEDWEDDEADDDGDEEGNRTVTDDDGDEAGDGEAGGEGDDGEAGDDDEAGAAGSDESDGDDGEAGEAGAGDGDDGDDAGAGAGDDDGGEAGAGDDESGESGEGFDADGDGGESGEGESEAGDEDDDDWDGEGGDGIGHGGSSQFTSRLAEWQSAIDQALESNADLGDLVEAVVNGPMPMIKLPPRSVKPQEVPHSVRLAEADVARELRLLMDGVRPGMRRRVDRGRFNLSRVIREGGTTRAEEMFDRHDPGALRSTGCAVAVLCDVSGSMGTAGVTGVSESMWSVGRAVLSVRGAFKAWTFGNSAEEMPEPRAGEYDRPVHTDGSTDPLLGLSASHAWLTNQRQPNKLCIVATDGGWHNHHACVAAIRSMTGDGIHVAIFGIGGVKMRDLVARFGKTDASLHHINEAADLGPATNDLIVNRVKRAVRR